MKTSLLTFTLASLIALASPAEARREIQSFDELVEATQADISRMDELQREAEKPFLIVAPRCLNNWPAYKAEYERVHSELKSLVQPLLAPLAEFEQATRGLNFGSPHLTLDEACSADGARIEANILRKLGLTKDLTARLNATAKAVDILHRRAFQTFVRDAEEKDFGRGLSCMFKYQYRDVALLAMFRDYYPRGERAPAPALYQLGEDLDSANHWAHEEEKDLTENLVRVNTLRPSCRR